MALDFGVSTLETDLAITRDGVVVISHDPLLNPDLTRGPDGQWLTVPGPVIRTLTLDELKRYDVGRLNPASKYAQQYPEQKPVDGQRIPTLAEFFALAGPDVRFNIEIKTDPNKPDLTIDPAAFAAAAVDGIRKGKAEARSTLQSFDWRGLIAAKKLAPAIATGCLSIESNNFDTVQRASSRPSPLAGWVRSGGARRLGPEAGPGGRLRHLVAVLAQRHGGERKGGPGARPESRPLDGERPGRNGAADRSGCRRADHGLSRSRRADSQSKRPQKPLGG